MDTVDIAIAGGGMVGLSLAAALHDSGLSVGVISDQPFSREMPAEPALRVSAINGANYSTLSDLGVWQRMPHERVSAYNTMSVWDKDSFGKIHFSKEDLPAPQLGHIIENQLLTNALADTVAQQSYVKLIETRIQKVLSGQRETMLMLENDQVLACRLLVGADGANSFVRRQAQFPLTFKDYGHTAIVATVRTSVPHKQCARQVFTPDGPLALLPLSEPDLVSIVWSQTNEVASSLTGLSDEAFNHALSATSDGVLGVLSVESKRHSFPLIMRYARQWAKNGMVIIGDAAHTIHPLAGQGANLGMRDAFALAETLKICVQGDKDFASLENLRAFERARKADAMAVVAAMDGFKTLFAGNHPLKKFVRGAGLVMTDAIPAIKRQWLAQAMGW